MMYVEAQYHLLLLHHHLLDCRSPAAQPGSSRKCRSAPSYSAQSRYLGTLKVLEQKACLQETGLDTADSLRATVYQVWCKLQALKLQFIHEFILIILKIVFLSFPQDWLKKKEEKLQATFRVKKQEEKLKEEKKIEVFVFIFSLSHSDNIKV